MNGSVSAWEAHTAAVGISWGYVPISTPKATVRLSVRLGALHAKSPADANADGAGTHLVAGYG
jgi:hypothetical protein